LADIFIFIATLQFSRKTQDLAALGMDQIQFAAEIIGQNIFNATG